MSKPIKDGGPAFPGVKEIGRKDVVDIDAREISYDVPQYQHLPGMSLRDYFAAAALQGLLAAETEENALGFEQAAQLAYEQAEAMLAERAKDQ